MEWGTLTLESNEDKKFVIAHQIFRRAEYVCRWRLRGEQPIDTTEIFDALKGGCLIDPLFTDESITTEWGELSAGMVADIREECMTLFDGSDVTERFIGLSDTMFTVASRKLIDVVSLQSAITDFSVMQQPMLIKSIS